MKKISIVSSFSESCGNAYFTEVLLDGIKARGYEADCASLDLTLTQAVESSVRKKADSHIQQMCEQLKTVDGVNIQFEAGLYGTLPSDIVKRFRKLLHANKNTSVTLHSPRLLGSPSGHREVIRLLLTGRIKSAYKKYMDIVKGGVHERINRKIVNEIVKGGNPIIVHTNRAKEQIKKIYDYDNVVVHPLKFVGLNRSIDRSKLKNLKNQYKLSEDDRVIGMFGYISQYKGHTTALEAIKRLPDNYKLFIFGRVHPQTIRNGESVNGYINDLISFVTVYELQDRVFFLGEVSTDDFIDYAGSVDFVWLPYLEVGQDGSGIASICCDVSNSVLASNSYAFDELTKLIPYPGLRRFDIGHAMELAQKTQFSPEVIDSSTVKNAKFNVNTQTDFYLNSMNF